MRVIRTPRDVDIAITSECNLRCSYCSFFTSEGDVHIDLPTEDWLAFFDDLGRNCVLRVKLGGGEPFFRQDIVELLEGIVRNRMRFSILSNGALITDEIASFLASTGRCDFIQVSVDGSGPESHDVFRGKGSFEKAIRGIKILQRHNVIATVRMTIHKGNLHHLEETSRLLLEEVGLPGFSTNAASYMGMCRIDSEKIQLNTEERSLAMETLTHLNQKYHGRIMATAGPLSDANRWSEWILAREEGKAGPPNGGYLTACGGVFETLAVRSDGIMVPCSQLTHIELGRILKDDLGEVWRDHPELNRLRERRSISLKSFDYCKGCEYIDFCTGNCPAMAYYILGTDEYPSPDSCLKRFLEEGGRLPVEPLLKESQ